MPTTLLLDPPQQYLPLAVTPQLLRVASQTSEVLAGTYSCERGEHLQQEASTGLLAEILLKQGENGESGFINDLNRTHWYISGQSCICVAYEASSGPEYFERFIGDAVQALNDKGLQLTKEEVIALFAFQNTLDGQFKQGGFLRCAEKYQSLLKSLVGLFPIEVETGLPSSQEELPKCYLNREEGRIYVRYTNIFGSENLPIKIDCRYSIWQVKEGAFKCTLDEQHLYVEKAYWERVLLPSVCEALSQNEQGKDLNVSIACLPVLDLVNQKLSSTCPLQDQLLSMVAESSESVRESFGRINSVTEGEYCFEISEFALHVRLSRLVRDFSQSLRLASSSEHTPRQGFFQDLTQRILPIISACLRSLHLLYHRFICGPVAHENPRRGVEPDRFFQSGTSTPSREQSSLSDCQHALHPASVL